LVGCAIGGAQIHSSAFDAGGAPIRRLVVVFNARSPHFTDALYAAFVSSTQRRLESCGINVTVLEFDPRDPRELEMRWQLAQRGGQADPDAVLTFNRNGGKLVTGLGGTSGNLYFDAEATDSSFRESLWRARIDFRLLTRNVFADDKLSGERFAAQFVSRLAGDSLITGCPPDIVAPKPQ
jgi:hypothetical protein